MLACGAEAKGRVVHELRFVVPELMTFAVMFPANLYFFCNVKS
jgi:hypothetical protein